MVYLCGGITSNRASRLIIPRSLHLFRKFVSLQMPISSLFVRMLHNVPTISSVVVIRVVIRAVEKYLVSISRFGTSPLPLSI